MAHHEDELNARKILLCELFDEPLYAIDHLKPKRAVAVVGGFNQKVMVLVRFSANATDEGQDTGLQPASVEPRLRQLPDRKPGPERELALSEPGSHQLPDRKPGPERERALSEPGLHQLPDRQPGPERELAMMNSLSKSSQELLVNILKSVRLSLDDIYLHVLTDQSFSMARLIRLFGPGQLIYFGSDPNDPAIDPYWEKYTLYDLAGTQFLLCDSLEDLDSDLQKNLKKRLWTQLKAQFPNLTT